mgnify:CR=1 FL=1
MTALPKVSLKGRVVLVNFVFTGCSTICPVQTRALADLQAQVPEPLRRQVHFLSISLDPLSDTPQALKAYGMFASSADKGAVRILPDEV